MFEERRGAGHGALGWEAGRTADIGAGEGQAPKEQGVTLLGAQSTPPRFPDSLRGELREHPQGFQDSPGIRHHTTISMTSGQDSLTLNKIYSGLNFRSSVEGCSFCLHIGPGCIFAFFTTTCSILLGAGNRCQSVSCVQGTCSANRCLHSYGSLQNHLFLE